MKTRPWWLERVDVLSQSALLNSDDLGDLRHASDLLREVRDNTEPALLAIDFMKTPASEQAWTRFEHLEQQTASALASARILFAEEFRKGAISPSQFRSAWGNRGFVQNDRGAGTPADDFLDGLFDVERLCVTETRPEGGTVNMASRAFRISDFIECLKPGENDVVFDLGSGSGKWALSVAASTRANVKGVEIRESYVDASRASMGFLGIRNAEFLHADVRDVDVAAGNLFHLYYPFHGEVAQQVAHTLAQLAEQKPLSIYLTGPENGFGEFFQAEVRRGALRLLERRGEFDEVQVVGSAV